MLPMKDSYTSTGYKFFSHQEAMNNLRNRKGQAIVGTIMLTDLCNHTCAFCSVQHRTGDSLRFADVMAYVDELRRFGLKAVILSGGGNPILYRDGKKTFTTVVDELHARGLEVGLITNGMPMREFQGDGCKDRVSWKAVSPATLDKLTWVRISMSGLDHVEDEVFVPDVDPRKTTLGFSYVAHDIYDAPEDTAHGKVSTEADVLRLGSLKGRAVRRFEDRIFQLTARIGQYVHYYRPRYVRLLPNCLEPDLIPKRCAQLQEMADAIDPSVVFVQNKPPRAPKACYLGYVHPVLNSDGYVYPCDSCVLNDAAGHQFANPWRICHWSEVARIYDEPVRSLIADPAKTCSGCVFSKSNDMLGAVVDGTANLTPPADVPEHANFV